MQQDHYEDTDVLLEGSIRKNIFKALDKNPLLKPKDLCKLLDLPYQDYKGYVTTLRYEWKKSLQNRQLLKCLKFHGAKAWIYVPKSVDSEQAHSVGWIQTKAKNRMLLWKDKNGRLMWFPSTRRCNLWIRKPSSRGKALQLLANAFFNTSLIFDNRLWQPFCKSIRFKGAHATLDLGVRLPYSKIAFLKESNGVIVKTGDASDPSSIEIEFCYPDYVEKNERVLHQNMQAMDRLAKVLEHFSREVKEKKEVRYID